MILISLSISNTFALQLKEIERVSIASDGTEGNGNSSYSSISGDGRYISFDSSSTNLVPGDTNGQSDIFVYDRDTNTIERVSIASDGTEGNGGFGSSYYPSISYDGKYILFSSSFFNLVQNDTNSNDDVFLVTRYTPPPPTSGGQSGVRFICKDSKATNYNPTRFGKHKQSLCKYKKTETSLNTKECPHFTKYFEFGDKDEEIKKIQTFLQEQGINTGYLDSIIGPIIFNAIKQFQNKYFNEILKP